MTIEERAAAVIGKWKGGAVWDAGNPEDLARALAEDGSLAPDLPEADDPTASFVPYGKGWLLEGDTAGPVVWTAPGGRVMIQRIEPGELPPAEARAFATNILAAADFAEKEQS